MTKTKLKWRLKEIPTPQDLTELVEKGILTKEEAKSILVSEEEVDEKGERTIDDLKAEIKFLREIVDKLSNKSYGGVIEVIRESQSYKPCPWYRPYTVWCNSSGGDCLNTFTTIGDSTSHAGPTVFQSFSDIKTF